MKFLKYQILPIHILIKLFRYGYMAFGNGPRNCIAMRFVSLETKMAIVDILKNYDFHWCDKTVSKIRLDPKSEVSSSLDGLWVKVSKRFE